MQLNDSLWNESSRNGSFLPDNASSFIVEDDVLEYLYVRIPLIVAYTIVFLCCFFGNLMVIIVVMVHRRMRTATNFFLANLALADFCVGIFCVYQNLVSYLTDDWAFGDFMCRMYHFILGLSYTASVLILTIISIERYIVIVHPMWGRRFITLRRLRIVLAILWLLSAIYNCPRLVLYGIISIHNTSEDDYGVNKTLCVYQKGIYSSKEFEIYNFAFLFVFPLIVMGVLYTSICLKLWKSERLHGIKKNNLICCFCRKEKRRSIPRPLLRIIETPSIQSSITQPLSRQASVKNSSPANPSRQINLVVSPSVPDDSSSEENDDRAKQSITGSLKSVNTIKSGVIRQSSFRSGNTRRSNANIKFADDECERNRLTSEIQPQVLNLLQQPSCRIIINDESSDQKSSDNKDSKCKELLLNQVDNTTDKMEKKPTVQPVLLTDEKRADLSTVSQSIRGSFRRYLIRSVSQHSHQNDGSETPVNGASLRSFDCRRPDNFESASQQNRNVDYSGVLKKRAKGKIKRKGSKVLRSRRKIIRLLIAVLCTFAVCNLPYHARKFWQSWSWSFDGSSTSSTFITIATTLILYMNSGINPFLYAFLSANFRKSIEDVFLCRRHLWSTHVFSPNASNNSRLTSSSSGPISTGSMSSAVSNF